MLVKCFFASALVFLLLLTPSIRTEEVDFEEDGGLEGNYTQSGEVSISDTEVDESEVEKAEKKRAVEETNEIQEEVKAELDRAVESLKETAKEREEEHNGLLSPSSLEPCGSIDCNNRGTCLGTKKTYICACQLGFSGKSCEETVCDSARDCNGRGLCLGTTSQLTCLCNLGFTGRRCQTPI